MMVLYAWKEQKMSCWFILVALALGILGCSKELPNEVAAVEETVKSLPSKRTLVDLIENVDHAVVRIDAITLGGDVSLGSGFVVDKNGTIVTNYHVITISQS